jgi:hypothetical protein
MAWAEDGGTVATPAAPACKIWRRVDSSVNDRSLSNPERVQNIEKFRE